MPRTCSLDSYAKILGNALAVVVAAVVTTEAGRVYDDESNKICNRSNNIVSFERSIGFVSNIDRTASFLPSNRSSPILPWLRILLSNSPIWPLVIRRLLSCPLVLLVVGPRRPERNISHLVLVVVIPRLRHLLFVLLMFQSLLRIPSTFITHTTLTMKSATTAMIRETILSVASVLWQVVVCWNLVIGGFDSLSLSLSLSLFLFMSILRSS